MLAWKIAPALAMGNTVVLKPAPYTSLTALLFCQIVVEAGVPPGVINILPGDGFLGSYLCTHAGVDKVVIDSLHIHDLKHAQPPVPSHL